MCGCGCLPGKLAEHRVPMSVAMLTAKVQYLEAAIGKKAKDGKDPCAPEPDQTPQGASEALIECCLSARADYLICLLGCDDSQACCAQCHTIYDASIQACINAHGGK